MVDKLTKIVSIFQRPELGHITHRNHGKVFIAYMDKYLPYWRETKNKLNALTLDYMNVS